MHLLIFFHYLPGSSSMIWISDHTQVVLRPAHALFYVTVTLRLRLKVQPHFSPDTDRDAPRCERFQLVGYTLLGT